ncbi:MAG: hypothetical protein KKD01_13860 [Proteobacteria bacterium]|nr:hypothetical protein [Pseudomonadota bacterium]MBU1138274.1 hypothetical protein [Pseudomonadota bacterium]MBU1231488.1 hypothetical protein [Pseudomonadota bacterium]MBU1419434.1 hypothetical protein [Pseudomonadota bacterium]MBU1455806.1 hypothetical protein [Pseudomonadota bacterium]
MKKICIGAGISLVVLSSWFCLAADKVVVVPLNRASEAIPAGAVMHFNLASCPDGWSPIVEGQGRVLVGISSSGGLGATVGAPLSDGGSRVITDVASHQHTVDPAPISTNSSGEHTHNLHIENMDSYGTYAVAGSENNAGGYYSLPTYSAGTHSHSLDLPSTSTSATGSGNVDVTMPYLQLLICEKL